MSGKCSFATHININFLLFAVACYHTSISTFANILIYLRTRKTTVFRKEFLLTNFEIHFAYIDTISENSQKQVPQISADWNAVLLLYLVNIANK